MVHLTFGFKISLDLGAKSDIEWAQMKAIEEDAKGKISWVNWVHELKAPVNQEEIKKQVDTEEPNNEDVEEIKPKAPGIG